MCLDGGQGFPYKADQALLPVGQVHEDEDKLQSSACSACWVSSLKQLRYDGGLADAALELGLPIRIDRAFPGDVLASARYGARTVHRCTTDQDPSSSIQDGLETELSQS